MKTSFLGIMVLLLPLILLTHESTAQVVYTFDNGLEGWNSKTPAPPVGVSTSISWDKGSGNHNGLAVIMPNENPQSPGTTATIHTVIYAPRNNGDLKIKEYNYLKVTLKNKTDGNVLQIGTKPDAKGSKWSTQNLQISTQDSEFKTYTFTLDQKLKGENVDIKILVAKTKGLWINDTKVYIDKIEFFK